MRRARLCLAPTVVRRDHPRRNYYGPAADNWAARPSFVRSQWQLQDRRAAPRRWRGVPAAFDASIWIDEASRRYLINATGVKRVEKATGPVRVELWIRGFHAQKEPVATCVRKFGHIEHRMVRHRQSIER